MAIQTQARETRFNGLFDAHYSTVRAYAWRRDPSSADDVVAETFLVAWRRLEDVPADSLPWLIGVARNVRLNMLRGERRRSDREDRAGARAPEPSTADLVLGTLGLREALARLSERDREVILLVAWEGLDRAAVARVLGCSRANVALRLFRARRRLEDALVEPEAPLVNPPTEGAPDAC
jgi:RNA polymerase sigma-70 factor (ECF subfamily)